MLDRKKKFLIKGKGKMQERDVKGKGEEKMTNAKYYYIFIWLTYAYMIITMQ